MWQTDRKTDGIVISIAIGVPKNTSEIQPHQQRIQSSLWNDGISVKTPDKCPCEKHKLKCMKHVCSGNRVKKVRTTLSCTAGNICILLYNPVCSEQVLTYKTYSVNLALSQYSYYVQGRYHKLWLSHELIMALWHWLQFSISVKTLILLANWLLPLISAKIKASW